ncbi:DUF1593 domain-containing protein [Rhodopirellula europaea]|uniref:Secreted protein containing DUF1593 n=1 Tax=Rhodopirellula europaea SH398 TaxID=1263868 RepID=M5SC43_9BACT|nr:DUF1593 domain-containing protein [Rhodopirellula europaea]EMI25232.1 secreted protein containing DUF1593 [Rhodopirellula europaea SH398]
MNIALRIFLTAAFALPCAFAGAEAPPKARMVVLTDIEADPDDTQSLVRLLLYSNLIDIEAIVATTSVHQKDRIAPESIRRVIEAYANIQPNLLKHEADFPTAHSLLDLVTEGLPLYGMKGVGDDKDSPGSSRIIELLDKDDDRPLWISVWGGPNTLAQALFRIRETRSPEQTVRLVKKLRVYTISDQDDSGIWLRNEFPNLQYIVSPGRYERSTWGAINQVIDGIDNTTISNEWFATNIQQSHGPLGAAYPDVAWGVEGDTPAYLGLIPNGLNVPERPDWGGWGGRYELSQPTDEEIQVGREVQGGVPIKPETRTIWMNADDTYRPRVFREYGRAERPDDEAHTGNRVTLWRWRDDFQNDFAARMDWCLSSYEDANHPPVPALSHPETFTVDSGEAFRLDAGGTTDPDGDSLSFTWMQYPEAGSSSDIKVDFGIFPENVYQVNRVAPEVSDTETMHFILKVTDKGLPPLTRYKRVIVTVQPSK